jgi:tRNA (cmo5U34)-methyltransferase
MTDAAKLGETPAALSLETVGDVRRRDPDDDRPRLAIPGDGTWTFKSPAVAADFDRHVREQLPWYDLATGLVLAAGRAFIPEGGFVYDIGASTGNVGRALAPVLAARKAELVGIEQSAEMAARYDGPGRVEIADARSYPYKEADLIVCFLVLMFVPVHERKALLYKLSTRLRPGGALLVFDKLAPRAGEVGALSLRLTLGAKYEAGASADEIIAKELSLAGVQRPLHPREVADFEPIFRFGDFGGWLRVAEP